MADLIDRDALMADIATSVVFSGRTSRNAEMRGANKIIDRIKAAPTVDAVEVVRCRECKYLEKDDGLKYGRMCLKFGNSSLCHDDDFCNYGERKEGAN